MQLHWSLSVSIPGADSRGAVVTKGAEDNIKYAVTIINILSKALIIDMQTKRTEL